MKKLLKKMVKNVENSKGSIYTKEDVLDMLNDLKEGNDVDDNTSEEVSIDDTENDAIIFSEEKRSELISFLEDKFSKLNVTDFVNQDYVSFEIDFDNKVQITNVEVDFSTIVEEIVDELIETIESN